LKRGKLELSSLLFFFRGKKMSDKEIRVRVSGGDQVENDLVADSIHHHLKHGGFEKVVVQHDYDVRVAEPATGMTLYDAIDRLRPDLFETCSVVDARQKSFPDQPVVVDQHGTERYDSNEIVRYLLDEGPFDMNHLARVPFPLKDRQQFAQLIGYSTDGYDTLSYSPAAIAAERAEQAREEVERIRLHGAAPMTHTAIVARDSEPPPDPHTFDVEVPNSTDGEEGDNTAP
jgi:hypothetical protein